ncbi:hypothetical protein IMCC3317_11710 [Kordia antarctica]|uniref:Uncharacterized protein n=1 Tax=Kordia antarctica TaxID=1218801 RepID=A0A7L4ZGI2_9FLAO|nr:hypothetical protein [Kordia antarctica]QHI35823.1 hypothetical protein IMCC3317_11710 [Kordia antarctica]
MLGTILETIKRLENREQLSKEDKELLEFLHSQAWAEINMGIVNLISYGDRLGWEKIEDKFSGMLNLIDKAKNK